MTWPELATAICVGMCAQAVLRMVGGAVARAVVGVALRKSAWLMDLVRADQIETGRLRRIAGLDK